MAKLPTITKKCVRCGRKFKALKGSTDKVLSNYCLICVSWMKVDEDYPELK